MCLGSSSRDALTNSNRSTPLSVSRALKRTPIAIIFAGLESLYRAYAGRCILIQGPHKLWSVSLLTTSSSVLWRFLRVLLCSIAYTDFGELTFHALR